ncbi:MAG: fibrobacter succinogenes major paralogous domain-containing protein [Chitinispirillia bacterium]|nr:fibrobacter succinogenes major paralogous domain-containing protein [Chitinispirillia bacterium]MCL2268011.1 fibrobacter succinogenes major paralogous domain-containing protein [Chitinispirillia bacterium]
MQTQKSIITILTVCLAAAILTFFGGCGGGNGGSFTDPRDGQTYRTTVIGNLTWMAENLNYASDSSWCYDNADSNCIKYGRLYNWDAAKAACSTMGAGWRLPVNADWWDLDDAVAGNWTTAGKKLKSKTGWMGKNNGTDKFGFSALPGGAGDSINFAYAGSQAQFWNGEEPDKEYEANARIILYDQFPPDGWALKSCRLSVRCVRE